MKILINASNLKQGGGVQVADSVCRCLDKHPEHNFVVVLSSALDATADAIAGYANVETVRYDVDRSLISLLWGKVKFLDELVKEKKVLCVLTIFGPSRWKPKVPHLCGFARAQILPMSDSPYFAHVPWKEKILNLFVRRSFRICADNLWTENEAISKLLGRVFPQKRIFTVSNNYNQVFDAPESWQAVLLSSFEGTTLLTVTNAYPHKNLAISLDIARLLKAQHPEFKFRFVFTIDGSQFPPVEEDLKECFVFVGTVANAQCPSLYKVADIMFQPTLIECFTATYAEAMRMNVPIVTSDLSFARGLCGNAACYYAPRSAQEAAENIYEVATNTGLRDKLIAAGHKQLSTFLTAEERADKLIEAAVSIS